MEPGDYEQSELETESKTPTVLVIDSDELNLRVIKQVLSDLYEVAVATNPRDAFRIVDSYPIKVVITDQDLPRMTGVRFCEELEQTGNHSTRIIMTTFEHHREVEKALDLHQIFHILIKPVDVIRLKRGVNNAVADYEQRQGKRRQRKGGRTHDD
ncbi:MAG: response regulator [Myxococcota bacterium]|nr:response regulator [Myxococcota bacterium]